MAKLKILKERKLGMELAASDLAWVLQLVELRKQKGLTQAQVAERMGCDRSSVVRFEAVASGDPRNHTLLTAKKYAEAVGAYVGHVVVDGENFDDNKACQQLKRDVRNRITELRRANHDHEMCGDLSCTENSTIARMDLLFDDIDFPDSEDVSLNSDDVIFTTEVRGLNGIS